MERMLADTRLARPTLGRMQALVDVLGHPEASAPVIQVTGTNGKTSTARCLTSLLMAKGLRVGTFTSPHLEVINERIASDGEPISDADLAAVLGVNTNTVLRALRTLRDEGLLEMGRGRAITVAGGPDKTLLVDKARELITFSRSQGYRREELVALIQQLP